MSIVDSSEITGDSAERVAKGAAFMDAHYPGWERKIDLALLDINDGDQCICGQVVPLTAGATNGFHAAFTMMEKRLGAEDKTRDFFDDRGFYRTRDQDAWVSLIKDRFDAGALSDC